MAPQTLLVLVIVILATLSSAVQAFKDPHNVFCGKDECYSLLGLERGADKADIKKAYRAISLDVHPDKNPSAAAKEKFTVRPAILAKQGERERVCFTPLFIAPCICSNRFIGQNARNCVLVQPQCYTWSHTGYRIVLVTEIVVVELYSDCSQSAQPRIECNNVTALGRLGSIFRCDFCGKFLSS